MAFWYSKSHIYTYFWKTIVAKCYVYFLSIVCVLGGGASNKPSRGCLCWYSYTCDVMIWCFCTTRLIFLHSRHIFVFGHKHMWTWEVMFTSMYRIALEQNGNCINTIRMWCRKGGSTLQVPGGLGYNNHVWSGPRKLILWAECKSISWTIFYGVLALDVGCKCGIWRTCVGVGLFIV